MDRKFTAIVTGNLVEITNNRTGKKSSFSIGEFVWGHIAYNEETDKFPNYVHGEVWQQWENNRKRGTAA